MCLKGLYRGKGTTNSEGFMGTLFEEVVEFYGEITFWDLVLAICVLVVGGCLGVVAVAFMFR